MIKAVIFDFFGVLEKNGQPNEPLLVFIAQKLKPKYKIGVISNSTGNWLKQLLTPAQVKLFDSVVLSYAAGVAKPEAAIYDLCLKNLGVRANEAVFTDDAEDYCLAARAVGMEAIRYDNFEQFETDLNKLLAGSNN